jgi:hypothetical protein
MPLTIGDLANGRPKIVGSLIRAAFQELYRRQRHTTTTSSSRSRPAKPSMSRVTRGIE